MALALAATAVSAQQVEMKVNPRGGMELRVQVGQQQQVMGYTDAPIPADVEMPANMKAWLESVRQAAAYADQHPEMILGSAHPIGIKIEPLLGPIAWGQDEPFNLYTPNNNPSGCVATAMMQVMRYYQYPQQGTGQKTWQYKGKAYEADFGNTTYHWELMPETYNYKNLTDEQKEAMATLGYQSGVALEMMWGPDASAAYYDNLMPAMIDHFGYNPLMSRQLRECYTFEQWQELLIAELQAGRPIIYSGQSSDGGHAYIVDGINEEGLYHINWGWEGHYDGYYDICVSEYDPQEGEAFCIYQSATVQITPEHGVGKCFAPFTSDVFYVEEYPTKTNFYCEVYNTTGRDSIGDFGYELICVETEQADTVWVELGWEIAKRATETFSAPLDISSMADGTYHIRALGRIIGGERDGQTYPLIFKPVRKYDEFIVKNGNRVSVHDWGETISLEVSNFSHADQNISAFVPTTMTFDVTNTGAISFTGAFYLEQWDEDYGHYFTIENIISDDQMIHIAPGETQTVSMPVCFEKPFEMQISISGYDKAIFYRFETGYESILKCEFTEESPYKLNLPVAPKLLTDRCEVGGEVSFSLVVENLARPYDGQLAMQLFNSKKNPETNNLTPLLGMTTDVQIDAQARDTITITGTLEGLNPGKYYARPYYRNAEGNLEPLLRNGNLTAAIEVAAYPSAIEQIGLDQPAEVKRYDLLGRPAKVGDTPILIDNSKCVIRR